MNFQSPRPDRSPEAMEQRRKASDRVRAKNRHQGYRFDPILEDAKSRWVAGDITLDEYVAEMVASSTKR
jgi:hypothetical protein